MLLLKMAILYKYGDMFSEQTDAIVNTVNCVGVMGKGVALEFKRRWPENFKEYKKQCERKELIPGKVSIFDTGDMFATSNPRYLINFPTKQHWRSKSKISYIEDGLDSFVKQLRDYKIKSVTLPPLGCGNGGLAWEDVRALLVEKLSSIEDIDFVVYAPEEHVSQPEYKAIPEIKTLERAILIATIGEFEKYFGGHLTRISLQKIAYFLQALGIDYGLEFARNEHGPYSKKLKSAFKGMEKQGYITGYNIEDPKITVSPAAFAAAEDFLENNEEIDAQEIIQRLSFLIEGYESPYGMELLSSVHYLVTHEGLNGVDDVIEAIQNWNEHKCSHFPPKSIAAAHYRLKEDRLIN